MNDVLRSYLDAGLLDIGDDDSRLTHLEAAAQELSARFDKEPREALYHALTLFSESSAEDISFLEAGKALSNHWALYKNRFKEDPREVLRPVSFRALQLISEKKEQVGLALGYLLRTVPKWTAPVRDQVILAEFADYLDERAEAAAIADWTIVQGTTKATAAVPTVQKIDREALASQFMLSVGPSNAQNQAVTGANPNWPQASAAWSSEFGTRASEAVSANIEQALVRFANAVQKENANLLQQNALTTGAQASNGRRTQMLWWEKSSYSQRFRKSYQELPVPLALVTMVVELQEISGSGCPSSVEAFLRNFTASTLGTATIKIADIFEATLSAKEKLFATVGVSFDRREGAKTLFESLLSSTPPSSTKGRKSEVYTPANLSVRLFNELQALKLAENAR